MNPARRFSFHLLALLALAGSSGRATFAADDDPVMHAMSDELTRSVAQLKLENLGPPYFAAYRVVENTDTRVTASFGSIVVADSNRRHYRVASVELRVGSPEFDQTNFVAGGNPFGGFMMQTELPLDDNYTELRRQLWLATDNAYKQAVELLAKKKASLETKTRTDTTADLSLEPPTRTTEEVPRLVIDASVVEQLARDLSAVFREFPTVSNSSVALDLGEHLTRYINSEDTRYLRRETMAVLVVLAATQAVDGRAIENNIVHFTHTPGEFPSKGQLLDEIRELGRQVTALREAPLIVDPYNGPVLFENQAAAEVFAQVFVPRLIASKRPVVENPQLEALVAQSDNPFMDKLGARVLPDFLNVTDDATRTEFNGVPLLGNGKVDDEGVPSREIKLVVDGRLKTLLTSRVPSRGLLKSSGSRHGGGPTPSNLIVTARSGLTPEALKAELLKVVQERGKEFGVIVRRLANPAFRTMRDQATAPNRESGRIEPAILVYKVFPDGHEELLRNVEVSGITVSAFKDILVAGKDPFVYDVPFFSTAPGRGPSSVVISLAVPSLLFDEVNLKQPAGAVPKVPVAKHPFFDK